MNNPMLTFELADGGDKVEVHGNREGLLMFADLLKNLAIAQHPDHLHLMTKEWGGNELSSDIQGLQNVLINHAKIFVWP